MAVNHIDKGSDGNHGGLLMRMLALEGKMTSLRLELQELRRLQNQTTVKALVEQVYEEDLENVRKLRRDAVRVLNLLVDRDLVSREALNEATE